MNELSPEVIGGKIERIGLDFLSCESDLFIDERLNGIEPISVVPNMEIFLIFHQKHHDQLFLFFDDIFIYFEQIFYQPLSVAPNSIRFWVRLDQFCG